MCMWDTQLEMSLLLVNQNHLAIGGALLYFTYPKLCKKLSDELPDVKLISQTHKIHIIYNICKVRIHGSGSKDFQMIVTLLNCISVIFHVGAMYCY